MRLYKCRRVENYLIENNMVDERHIWCYAQIKAKIPSKEFKENLYGMVLVCVKQDNFYLYDAGFNSTNIELFYQCKISEMKEITLKKKYLSVRLSFTRDADSIRLDMDDWKRFSSVFVLGVGEESV